MVNRRTARPSVSRKSESARILKRSSLYHELRKEKKEIKKLKWIESEKRGEDIGYEKALFMWAHAHRNSWRAARIKKRLKHRS